MQESPLDAQPGLSDEVGPIRYDWQTIKLLYISGASSTDIARSLTLDCPDAMNRVRNTICKRGERDGWKEIREAGLKLTQNRPANSMNNDSRLESALSQSVESIAQNVYSARKSRYLDITTRFVDRSATALDNRSINNLEEAAMAAKLMEPVHAIAKDVHGLNAKEGTHNLQVNFLSDFSGQIPEVNIKPTNSE